MPDGHVVFEDESGTVSVEVDRGTSKGRYPGRDESKLPCLYLENAECSFRGNLLVNSHPQEIAKNSDTKYLLVLG